MTMISNENYDLIEIISNNIDDLLYILNNSFECEYVNERVHIHSIGYSCMSKKFTDYIHLSDKKKSIDFLRKILRNGEAVEEIRILSNDGYKLFEVQGKRFFDKLYNAKIFLISKDISKFKEIEDQWMKRTEKLREMTQSLPELRFWKLLQTKGSKAVIQKTHQMLDLVIESIPQYIFWKDIDLNYLGCNGNYADINELKDSNFIIGKKDHELPWSQNNIAHIQERELHVIKNNKAEHSIEILNLCDGNKGWFEVNRIPLHDLEDNIIGILSFYNNITDRITAEQKLGQSEFKYRSILENIKEGYFEVDLKGNFTFINNSFCEIFGYAENELLGSNYRRFADKTNREKAFERFNQVYKTGIGQKYLQFEFMKKDGEIIILETSVYLRYDSDGGKIGFYGMVHDITDKYLLEQELKQSEQKYRLISENAYDLISIINQDFKFEYANEQPFFDILGYKIIEIIGNSALKIIHPEDKNLAYNSLIQGLKTGEGAAELRVKTKSSNWVWIEVKGKTFVDMDGQIKGIIIGRDITERKSAEEKLKRSEKRFRHLFKSSPFTIWLLNSKGIVIDCNPTMNKLLSKYNKDDIVGKHFVDVLSMFERPEYFVPFFKEKFYGFINGEKIEPVEFQITRADGKSLWLTLQSSKITLGEELLIQVIIQDITEKKRAEEDLKTLNKQLEEIIQERTKKLRESEEKFRNIAEQTSLGIIILQEGYVTYTNRALLEITGYSNEEVKEWSKNEFVNKIYPEDLPYALEQLQQKLTGHINLMSHYSCRIITKSGEIKWIELHSKAITYQGKLADFITFIDITDKKIAEQRLIESEEKYRHLFENSPFGIVLLDFDGTIIDVNSTTPKLYGYTMEDLLGKNYLDLKGIYPLETKSALRNITNLLNKGEFILPKMKPHVIEIYKKDGTTAWVESEISTIKLGDHIFIQIIIQDITDKKIAEQKLIESEKILREQNLELRELDKLKSDFISIAAHELKTPLISVGGYVDLILMREKELKSEIKEDLNRVLINVRRLEDYINRLMDVMKIDAKKMELDFAEHYIHQIIEDTLLELSFQINQKELRVKVDVDKDFKMTLDSSRIYQVFSNLISNAIKFSNQGSIIEITAKVQDTDYLFSIRDYGKGLSEKQLNKLFGKFVTLGESSDNFSTFEKGSGLGLYIARGIIEAHGGKIWVKSEGLNKGAEFNFTIPIQID
ncbi:MAG: PAS domain S-box protein [Promethearchaeota archaeon]